VNKETHMGGPNGSEGDDAVLHEGLWTQCSICRDDPDPPPPDNFDNMTRRDWLAGLAMPPLLAIADNSSNGYHLHEVVEDSYRMADAMIKEGNK